MVAMTYELTITQKPTHLHAIVTGKNTKENVADYLRHIRSECISRNCYRIFIEERLEGPRLDTIDIFELAEQGSIESFGVFQAIAYIDENAAGDAMQFAETVARNRGIPIRVFSTVTDAEKWLLGEIAERG
jgi:hypothetical protein